MNAEINSSTAALPVRELSAEELNDASGASPVMEVRIMGYTIQAKAGGWAVWKNGKVVSSSLD